MPENVPVAQGVDAGTVYVDCAQHNTHTRVVRMITRTLNNEDETGMTIPRAGIGSSEYYDYLWEILNALYDAVIIILDEVDRLESVDVLMQLSRARESGKAPTTLALTNILHK